MAHDVIVFKHHLANGWRNDGTVDVIASELPYRVQAVPLRDDEILDANGQVAPKYRGTQEAGELSDCRKGLQRLADCP